MNFEALIPASPVPCDSQAKLALQEQFDPGGVGLTNGNLFGFPFDYGTADIIVLGIPWEVTASYGAGTALAPQAIRLASPQLDFYDFDHPQGWKRGIFMPPIPTSVLETNQRLRPVADRLIQAQEQGQFPTLDSPLAQDLQLINQACEDLNQWLFHQSQTALGQGKRLGIIGGDHSVPLGYLQALAQVYPQFGILQIDAHGDLRQAYEGFTYSHASIMHNSLEIPEITKLVQVGVRDICEEEVQVIEGSDRIHTHYDWDLKQNHYRGINWSQTCQDIIRPLPQQVYISFDVDGLDPKLCPHTGTPVPGGLNLEDVFYLLRQVVQSGRQVIGFDLCEVGNDGWDGNVGARITYKLCMLMALH